MSVLINEDAISAQDFEFFKTYLRLNSGYELPDDRKYLLVTKTGTVMKKHSLATIDDLRRHLQMHKQDAVARDFIDIMTINETSFFRDGSLFDTLRDVIFPAMLASGKKQINILCAGCSSGQEPYSIAIILTEICRIQGVNFDYNIHGIDISHAIIDRAGKGIFSDFEMERGMPDEYRDRYFDRVDGLWRVSPTLQKHMVFSCVNLADDFSFDSKFDIILARNVLIYFSDALKEKVLTRLAAVMEDDGYFGMGAMERISTLSHPFSQFAAYNGFYRKK